MRSTSLDTFKEITESGYLSKSREAVYREVFYTGPTTIYKVQKSLGLEANSVSPRFSELEEMGVIEVVGETVNPNGYKANLYAVTGKYPKKIETRTSWKKKHEMFVLKVINAIGASDLTLEQRKRLKDAIFHTEGGI